MKNPESFSLDTVEIALKQDNGYFSSTPAPDLLIKGDGNVRLIVQLKGMGNETFNYQISREAVLAILLKAFDEQFFRQLKSYVPFYLVANDERLVKVSDNMSTDAGSSEISITIEGRTHRVWSYFKSTSSFHALAMEILKRAEVEEYMDKYKGGKFAW